jgi:hypothetical protein
MEKQYVPARSHFRARDADGSYGAERFLDRLSSGRWQRYPSFVRAHLRSLVCDIDHRIAAAPDEDAQHRSDQFRLQAHLDGTRSAAKKPILFRL